MADTTQKIVTLERAWFAFMRALSVQFHYDRSIALLYEAGLRNLLAKK